MMSNAAKCFNILATNFVVLPNVLMVQQSYLLDILYPTKFLNPSAKLLF